jgi:hypothetical protein
LRKQVDLPDWTGLQACSEEAKVELSSRVRTIFLCISLPIFGAGIVGQGACNSPGAAPSTGTGGAMSLDPSAGTGGSGSGGFGGGEAVPTESIAGIPNQNGVKLADSFILMPCLLTAASDCVTALSCPPSNPNLPFERQGLTTEEVFPLGGEPGRNYRLTVKVNGIAEAKYYTGGSRAAGLSPFDTSNPEAAIDSFYTGGTPVESNIYNVYKLIVKDAAGNEREHYYLSSFPPPAGNVTTQYEGHVTYPIAFTHDIIVPGGGTFTLYTADRNCHAVDNCGAGYQAASCAPSQGRLLPNEPDLQLPVTYLGNPVAELNMRNGSAQPFHSQAFHIVITAASAL